MAGIDGQRAKTCRGAAYCWLLYSILALVWATFSSDLPRPNRALPCLLLHHFLFTDDDDGDDGDDDDDDDELVSAGRVWPRQRQIRSRCINRTRPASLTASSRWCSALQAVQILNPALLKRLCSAAWHALAATSASERKGVQNWLMNLLPQAKRSQPQLFPSPAAASKVGLA
jgi:hypothetical protein